ncbi:membrane protein, putative [Babesia bigemina]|uniref:Membrane protein, putative n=1 Tax=Babesia bigemina TaxID=5866 RepID=A0A061D649_BABBI|nr:membrane protein, putative [Babesia bigemina]CDR95492.1 membrane protein, putative [Babesia bigemina]|eukprot:XP_012767678.1 membrane protein, putative [Babesia bigemina]
MWYIKFVATLIGAFLTVSAATGASDPGGIHLNIEYPKDEQKGKLDVATGDGVGSSDIRTPVVIIAPKPLVDYERLYKKMMHSAPSEKGRANIEKDLLYNKKVAYSDPSSRRQLLFELLKEAEADLAFYRADYSEMELFYLITYAACVISSWLN